MIPKECKRLAEVDFPIAAVSRHSAREKNIRQGHPSALHLWWARRPVAACRAILMGLLLPDPSHPLCPEEFKLKARAILPKLQGIVGSSDAALRDQLLRFVADLARWENSYKHIYIETARALVVAAQGDDDTPLVVDPFSGGGAIPLEALRLGCEVFASELNPVACLILRSMLDDFPRHRQSLGADFRAAADRIRATAAEKLRPAFPPEPDGLTPIAYFWARTVICDACGCEIPLIRSFWLRKKTKRNRALDISIDRSGSPPKLVLRVFEPKTEEEVHTPTVSNGKATCPACSNSMSPKRVKAQLNDQKGGTDVILKDGKRIGGTRLLAVAIRDSGGIRYRTPEQRDWKALDFAASEIRNISSQDKLAVPTETVNPIRPSPNARGVSGATRIGITDFGRLFTARQKLALVTLAELIRTSEHEASTKRLLMLALSKLAERSSSFVTWINTTEAPRGTFSRQALTIAWDFVELVPVNTDEEFSELVEAMVKVIEMSSTVDRPAILKQASATLSPLSDEEAAVWFTDPPYYDAVPYADLSDYFYVWLKRILPSELPSDIKDTAADGLVPKVQECTWDAAHLVDGHPKNPAFFEQTIAKAFLEGRRILADGGIACVVFAHKTTEGWEALLAGMMQARWIINASWPIRTERGARLNAKDAAALATSVHLICRPRPANAPIGDWGDVIRELPQRVGDWIERLEGEGIKGADLVFACIGPAMEIYSRYSHVEDAEGRRIPLGGDAAATEAHKRGFLAYVWETVGRLALEEVLGTPESRARNGSPGALEEDSRLTALFLWTLQNTEADPEPDDTDDPEGEEGAEGGEDEVDGPPRKKKPGLRLIYDVARRFAQPLGIHLDKWEGRIIETEKGVVRLLPVVERAAQLFGHEDAAAISRRIEQDVKASRNYAFAFMQEEAAVPKVKPRGRGRATARSGVAAAEAPEPHHATTLDRVHAAMLLQRSGQTNGLRAMLKEEMQRGPDFLRLANALSRLYPKDSDEKRLLDAMLLAVPRN